MNPFHRVQQWAKERREQERGKLAGLVRVLGYFTVVGAFSGVYCVANARAEVGEKMFEIGQNLSELSDLVDTTHNFSMNGQHVYLSTGYSSQPFGKVLDRYEQHCKDNDGVFTELFKDAEPTTEVSSSLKLGILREQKLDQGALVCLTQGSRTASSVLQALQEFNETHDFGALGDIRYVHVKRTPDGRTKTTLLWSDGSLKLDELAPPDGREPSGRDPVYLPRPAESRRLISIDAVGTKYNAFVYTTDRKPEQVMQEVKSSMESQGWISIGKTVDDTLTRGFLRNDVTAYVGIRKDDENGKTIVGMSEIEPGAGDVPPSIR